MRTKLIVTNSKGEVIVNTTYPTEGAAEIIAQFYRDHGFQVEMSPA